MVIVILGILSAVALPRFANLASEARRAKVEAVYGAIRSAASIVRMACKVDAGCDPAEAPGTNGLPNISVAGQNISLAYGYPRRTLGGIARAAYIQDESDGGDYDIAQSLVGGVARLRIRPDADTAPEQCEVLYREPQAAGEAPEISIVTSGC